MKKYKPELFRSPISLPEGKSGRYAVSHKMVTGSTPIVGMRQALLRGVTPVSVRLSGPLKVHQLSLDNRVIMTDLPEELNQIAEAIYNVKPFGRVLVGGLGLGILAKILSQTMDVTVVEIAPEVVGLCADESRYEIVLTDLNEFVKTVTRGDFHCAMLDTWSGTSEGTWWEEVLPLRRALRQRGVTRVWCWAEDIMLGQVRRHLSGPRHWHSEKLPPMNPMETDFFLSEIGSPAWESLYGHLLM